MALAQNGDRRLFTAWSPRGGALTSYLNGGGLSRRGEATAAIRGIAYQTSQYAGRPVGTLAPASWMLPQKPGAMAVRATGAGALTAGLQAGIHMEVDLTGAGDLTAIGSLVADMAAALTGSGTLTAEMQAIADMVAALTGSGSVDATLSGLADLAAALTGAGSVDATLSGIADMSVDIVVTGTGLSTANVGQAVWAALAAANNAAGSMGEKLNDAGSAANPWTEVIEGSLTAAELLRLIAAALAGEITQAGDTITVKAAGGATVRITAEGDGTNRTDVVLDPD